MGHVVAVAVEVLAVWTLIGIMVGLVVGRAIALGQEPLTDRLAEVEADRLVDEARDPLFVG
jgi:HAMP domain-containing protein